MSWARGTSRFLHWDPHCQQVKEIFVPHLHSKVSLLLAPSLPLVPGGEEDPEWRTLLRSISKRLLRNRPGQHRPVVPPRGQVSLGFRLVHTDSSLQVNPIYKTQDSLEE